MELAPALTNGGSSASLQDDSVPGDRSPLGDRAPWPDDADDGRHVPVNANAVATCSKMPSPKSARKPPPSLTLPAGSCDERPALTSVTESGGQHQHEQSWFKSPRWAGLASVDEPTPTPRAGPTGGALPGSNSGGSSSWMDSGPTPRGATRSQHVAAVADDKAAAGTATAGGRPPPPLLRTALVRAVMVRV